MSALKAAVNVLNDRLVMAHAIGESLDAAAGEVAPPWVYVFREQVESIRQAAEAVEILVSGGAQ
jgi:hypothetical protein